MFALVFFYALHFCCCYRCCYSLQFTLENTYTQQTTTIQSVFIMYSKHNFSPFQRLLPAKQPPFVKLAEKEKKTAENLSLNPRRCQRILSLKIGKKLARREILAEASNRKAIKLIGGWASFGKSR